MNKSIMIVGVGGQGTLLASRILGNLAISLGYDVKVSEVHGMSQRGGSVTTYCKYGDKIYSPLIDKGEADIILAFEALEAYRALPYLKKDTGVMVINITEIDPMPVITGQMEYPKDIIKKIKEKAKVIELDSTKIASELGNPRCANVVLIGAFAKNLDIPYENWIEVIKNTVPNKFIELNINAFERGINS
ncbi:indolepyruvate oxidoreductase subunit beta [bacterium]|nr:indolepyruvate oxidoreductase subunit beta [bacterium]